MDSDKPNIRLLAIKSCVECPFHDVKREYTGDSFERVFSWFCTKFTPNVKVQDQLDADSPSPAIPTFCPLPTTEDQAIQEALVRFNEWLKQNPAGDTQ